MDEQGKAEATVPFTLALDDPQTTAAEHTGGKAAALARLTAAGLPVPDGFCVTTRVFRLLVDGVELPDLDDLDPAATGEIEEAARALRELIAGRPLPPGVERAVREAYTSMGVPAVSVRSSATVEDLPYASVAGQHDSYLNVASPEAVLDAVRACMGSLFTARAIAYRARNRIAHAGAAMAVVVQRMVDASSAGVLFTADPITGNRRTSVVEASFGLGEAVVSGAVATDRAVVEDYAGSAVTYQVGDKRSVTRMLGQGGTETVEAEPSRRTARVLSDAQVLRLVRTGRSIERLLGGPQDIEWAWDAEQLRVLQARPITSLFPVPEPRAVDGRLHVYLSVGHMQAFAEAMPPLAADVWMHLATSYWSDQQSARTFAGAAGRLYLDLSDLLRTARGRRMLSALLAQAGEQANVAVQDLLARRGDAVGQQKSRRRTGMVKATMPVLLPRLPRILGRLARAFLGVAARPSQESAWYDAWGMKLAARAREPDHLAGRIRRMFRPMRVEDLGDVYVQVAPLFAALAAPALIRSLVPGADDEVNAVGGGFPHDVVTRINQGLGDLADVARRHPAVRDALAQGASLEDLTSVVGGEAFTAPFAEYLAEFGHRATGEIDLSRPRWQEDPAGLLATIRANLAIDEAGTHRAHLRRIVREAASSAGDLEGLARRGRFGRLRAWAVRRLVRTYRGWIWIREHPKQGLAHAFTAWREVLLDAGEQLVERNLLAAVDDVWFLSLDELLRAVEGEDVVADIAARRAQFMHHRQLDAPLLLTSEGEIPAASTGADLPEGTLTGIPVSGGTIEGTARVVRDPAADTMAPGEILVALSTDPGWTPLFLNAAGLVTEVGGRFSHGAIVAREYRLPAVVSVTGATTRIRTGDRILLDGTRGTVSVLTSDRSPP